MEVQSRKPVVWTALFPINVLVWMIVRARIMLWTLLEKLFLTADNLNLELDQLQLEGERMGQTDIIDETIEADQAPQVEVTEMNKKKLTIKISEPRGSFTDDESVGSSTPSSASIQIVHTKSTPELHSILKQRSVSESSEDHSSGSTGESPTSTSPRDGECPKHVTFNSHVDRTHFKTNAATKTIRATLKNKRRHERKREAKKEKSRRRRNNSTGSECSSCDDIDDVKQSSESHSDEDHDDLSDLLEQTGSKVENSGVIQEEDESAKHSDESQENGDSKQAKRKRKKNKKKNKLAEEVKNKMAELKDEEAKCDSDDDDEDDVVGERTSKEDEVQNAQKDVSRTKVNEISEKVSNDLSDDTSDVKSVMAAKQGSEEIEGADSSGTSGAIKGDTPDRKEDGYHEKGGDDDGEPKDVVETELSWKEVDRNSSQNEHRTECAFKFSNAVMFDLDID